MKGEHCCIEMSRHWNDGEVAIVYIDKYREYGIRILDGGSSIQTISYCPWCGKRLPASLRHEWFDRLDALGKEPGDDIPPAMQSDEWWKTDPPPTT